jgi:hypothetical protein
LSPETLPVWRDPLFDGERWAMFGPVITGEANG